MCHVLLLDVYKTRPKKWAVKCKQHVKKKIRLRYFIIKQPQRYTKSGTHLWCIHMCSIHGWHINVPTYGAYISMIWFKKVPHTPLIILFFKIKWHLCSPLPLNHLHRRGYDRVCRGCSLELTSLRWPRRADMARVRRPPSRTWVLCFITFTMFEFRSLSTD